jgi:hypothetical protein
MTFCSENLAKVDQILNYSFFRDFLKPQIYEGEGFPLRYKFQLSVLLLKKS